jgi:hypothetical protein
MKWWPLLLVPLLMGALTYNQIHSLDFHQILAAQQDYGWGSVNKFGFNGDIDAAEETIYEGPDFGGPARVAIETTAVTLTLCGTLAADVGIPITAEGIDSNFDAQTDTQTLIAGAGPGTGTVALDGTWMFVNRAYNSDTDPTNTLSGNVYVSEDADCEADGIPDVLADIKTVIRAAENQTLQAAYMVPDGYVAFFNQFCASNLAAAASFDVRLRRSSPTGVPRTQSRLTLDADVTICVPYTPPIRYPARTLIEMTGAAGTSNEVSATFDLTLALDN